ncbi:MAG: DUF5683 domain-containing protein [Bacteroidota bacterium]
MLIVLLWIASPLNAQYIIEKAAPGVPFSYISSSYGQSDTMKVSGVEDSLSAPYHQTKSTILAMGLSAVLPGAGQIYNESYWKTPIILGIGGWFVYEWIQTDNLYRDYRDQYNASITPTARNGNSRLLTIREFYRDERDGFAWYLGILYAINILDAFVDASLFDFHKDSKVMLQPFPQPTGIAINFKVSF